MTTPQSQPQSRRIVLSKTIRCYDDDDRQLQQLHDGDTSHVDDDHVLNLMMICCEENEPYGGAENTATMFLELLCAAYERFRCRGRGSDARDEDYKTIRITIYHAQAMDYPKTDQVWDSYHGIIIPGSLSAAYDTHIDWIHRLLMVIQQDIHDKRRKTLGVCFGHQCFAHSLGLDESNNITCQSNDGVGQEGTSVNGNNQREKGEGNANVHKCGLATKSSVGPIAGRKSFELTAEGKFLLGGRTSSQCNHSLQKNQLHIKIVNAWKCSTQEGIWYARYRLLEFLSVVMMCCPLRLVHILHLRRKYCNFNTLSNSNSIWFLVPHLWKCSMEVVMSSNLMQ